jgi:hypothetical protein
MNDRAAGRRAHLGVRVTCAFEQATDSFDTLMAAMSALYNVNSDAATADAILQFVVDKGKPIARGTSFIIYTTSRTVCFTRGGSITNVSGTNLPARVRAA